MAVQPIHLVAYNDNDWHGCYRFTVHPDSATHVCFALDDLPELADDIAAATLNFNPDLYRHLARAVILNRLRGTAPGAGNRPDAVPG